jgi:hypothetical protein
MAHTSRATSNRKKTISTPPKTTATKLGFVYQFKITLKDFKPLIWRRIQVLHCTLNELHEHIQTAMGWTNSHLHQFKVDSRRYADPELMQEDMEEFGLINSRTTMLDDVLPANHTKKKFVYEYDFGDGWMHELAFEGRSEAEPQVKYPRCVEGENACPPEDSGGAWGYANKLEILKDKSNPDHEFIKEWIGESFDAVHFDVKETNKYMRKGLPDWHR